MKTSKTLAQG